MTKAIANVSLGAISIGLVFGNYWFTFGLWPKNWWSFFFFAIAGLAVALAKVAVDSEGKR